MNKMKWKENIDNFFTLLLKYKEDYNKNKRFRERLFELIGYSKIRISKKLRENIMFFVIKENSRSSDNYHIRNIILVRRDIAIILGGIAQDHRYGGMEYSSEVWVLYKSKRKCKIYKYRDGYDEDKDDWNNQACSTKVENIYQDEKTVYISVQFSPDRVFKNPFNFEQFTFVRK